MPMFIIERNGRELYDGSYEMEPVEVEVSNEQLQDMLERIFMEMYCVPTQEIARNICQAFDLYNEIENEFESELKYMIEQEIG